MTIHRYLQKTKYYQPEMLVLGGSGGANKSVQKYSPGCKQYTTCGSLPLPCNQSAIAADEERVYVAGGNGNNANIQVRTGLDNVKIDFNKTSLILFITQ